MHRLTVAVALVALLLTASCSASSPATPGPTPSWLTALIHDLESQPVASPPAFVGQYDYAGRTVYYVPPRCCDIWGTVYDADGVVLCHPDGGVTGSGDGRCPDFLSQRKNERIVWRDPRG